MKEDQAQPRSTEAELFEQDATKASTEQGLFRKFDVRRNDGSDLPGGKHDGCEYFVLDVAHDQHARAALSAYANACEGTHPHLASNMRERYGLAPQPRSTIPEPAELTDAVIAEIALIETGFDGEGTQAMNAEDIQRIVRAALAGRAA